MLDNSELGDSINHAWSVQLATTSLAATLELLGVYLTADLAIASSASACTDWPGYYDPGFYYYIGKPCMWAVFSEVEIRT